VRSTIADIAREARVSQATVSRVLNDKAEGVGAETRQRVKDVMARLRWQPCGMARGLATGRSRAVGLVVPDIADPFYPLIIKGAEETLRRVGYGTFLCDSDHDVAKEREHVRILVEKRVDGVILNSGASDFGPQMEMLERHGVPCVLLDRVVEGRRPPPGVFADNRGGAAMAVGYLLDGGARRLCFLNGPPELAISRLRRQGVDDAVRARRLDPAAVLHATGDYSVGSGERAVEALLGARRRPPFDALFAANDRMAIGALRALKRRGVRVPEDVELVGFDDIELATLVEPPLTTVAQPAFEMGQRSAELLLQLIEGVRPRRRTVVLAPSFVVRGTTRSRTT
jgi:LacI family transcriptional regulator